MHRNDVTWQGAIKTPQRKGTYFLPVVVRAMRSNENFEDSEEDLLWNMSLRVDIVAARKPQPGTRADLLR